MPDANRGSREKLVAFRVRPGERRLLDRAAAASGRSLSDLVRTGGKVQALAALSDKNHRQEDR